MKKVILLSHSLSVSTPAFAGAVGHMKIHKTRDMACGDSSESHRIEIGNHLGTHIDYPAHFCPKGKRSHEYIAEFWHFENVGFITAEPDELIGRVHELDPGIELLLLKTGFGSFRGQDRYWNDQPVFRPELATALRARCPSLRVFGFDMISLSSQRDRELGRTAHRAFLCEAGILLIEDMNLSGLFQAPESVVVAPWQIDGLDGSPCTVYGYF